MAVDLEAVDLEAVGPEAAAREGREPRRAGLSITLGQVAARVPAAQRGPARGRARRRGVLREDHRAVLREDRRGVLQEQAALRPNQTEVPRDAALRIDRDPPARPEPAAGQPERARSPARWVCSLVHRR